MILWFYDSWIPARVQGVHPTGSKPFPMSGCVHTCMHTHTRVLHSSTLIFSLGRGCCELLSQRQSLGSGLSGNPRGGQTASSCRGRAQHQPGKASLHLLRALEAGREVAAILIRQCFSLKWSSLHSSPTQPLGAAKREGFRGRALCSPHGFGMDCRDFQTSAAA